MSKTVWQRVGDVTLSFSGNAIVVKPLVDLKKDEFLSISVYGLTQILDKKFKTTSLSRGEKQ